LELQAERAELEAAHALLARRLQRDCAGAGGTSVNGTIYFDNVGGALSDLVITQFMAKDSRVVVCGQVRATHPAPSNAH
jgi:NADPH-dependent curcumin reductase CurA